MQAKAHQVNRNVLWYDQLQKKEISLLSLLFITCIYIQQSTSFVPFHVIACIPKLEWWNPLIIFIHPYHKWTWTWRATSTICLSNFRSISTTINAPQTHFQILSLHIYDSSYWPEWRLHQHYHIIALKKARAERSIHHKQIVSCFFTSVRLHTIF